MATALDWALGLIGLVFVVFGAIAVLFGLMAFGEKKGKRRLMGGAIAAVIGILLIAWVGVPSLQLPTEVTTEVLPTEVKIIDTSNGNIDQATKQSISSQVTINSTSDSIVSNGYISFNFTVTLGGDNSQEGTTYKVKLGTVPTMTNSLNSTISAPVIDKQADGDFDAVITVGTNSYDEEATVVQNELSTTTIRVNIVWDEILAQLTAGAASQYPASFTVTILIQGQSIQDTTLSVVVTVIDNQA